MEQAADAAASAILVDRAPIYIGGASALGIARQPVSDKPVQGIEKPVPSYLQELHTRVTAAGDREVKFFATEIAPLAQIWNKYPPQPLREGLSLDIPGRSISDFSEWVFIGNSLSRDAFN